MKTDVLIVGAGLAGLSLANHMQQRGRDWLVVEARDRLGGRILSRPIRTRDEVGPEFDLGPAWFWPGQPKIEQLVGELGVAAFEQYSQGTLVFEGRDGAVQRDIQYSTMAGALRVDGGLGRLIEALAERIPRQRVSTGCRLASLRLVDEAIEAGVLSGGRATTIHCNKVVLALPPRLAAASILFEPEPGAGSLNVMGGIPTWMAGHAKVIAVYERPFWREAGLSGDGVSHRGPLVEIHDASPHRNPQGALFGFVGVPATLRVSEDFDLADRALAQLIAMFGTHAANPLEILVQDWAREAFTSTAADCEPQAQGHHAYTTPPALSGLWDGRLLLGSSEMGAGFAGYLEGALEVAESIAARI